MQANAFSGPFGTTLPVVMVNLSEGCWGIHQEFHGVSINILELREN
jgi:hypothetical protein